MSSDFSGHFQNKSYGRFSEHRFLNFVYFQVKLPTKYQKKIKKIFFLFFFVLFVKNRKMDALNVNVISISWKSHLLLKF